LTKTYKIVNWTAAGWLLYLLLLPFISKVMVIIAPSLWRCAYFTYTGTPCPLCGLTRALNSLIHGDIETALKFHRLILPVAGLLTAESIFRAVTLVRCYRDRIQPLWIKADIWVHSALAVLVPLMFLA